MGHRDDCYSPDYARERGREEYRTGWYSPYAMGDCNEAQQAYDEGMRAERRSQENRRQMREQEEAEYMYYAQQQAEEAAMEVEYQDYLNEQMAGLEREHWARIEDQETQHRNVLMGIEP